MEPRLALGNTRLRRPMRNDFPSVIPLSIVTICHYALCMYHHRHTLVPECCPLRETYMHVSSAMDYQRTTLAIENAPRKNSSPLRNTEFCASSISHSRILLSIGHRNPLFHTPLIVLNWFCAFSKDPTHYASTNITACGLSTTVFVHWRYRFSHRLWSERANH